MNAVLVDVGAPATCHPLTCTRNLADCPVANRPLAEAQRQRLQAAGFGNDAATGARLFLRGDAWLSVALLQALRSSQSPTAVVTADGQTLAHTGTAPDVSPTVAILPADAESFAIRFPWDLLRINEILVGALAESRIEAQVSANVIIDGILVAGVGTRILPGVYVEGKVIVGRNCKIGPNCYLRGSTAIGDDCHIGQAVEVKNSIIMSRSALAHLSYCGDSIIGERVNFGAGTIAANFRHDGGHHWSRIRGEVVDTGRRKFGTVMGDHVHTGINTSIYPGRKLWPHVSTLPGEVVQADKETPHG